MPIVLPSPPLFVVLTLCVAVWLCACQVVVQDLVTRRQQILPGLNTIAALAASPNGQFLACSGDGWDAFGRSPVSLWRLCDDGDDDAADAGAFADEAGSPSGVGSGGSGWRLLGNLHFHDTVITTLHFSADNRYLVSVGSPTEPEDDEGDADPSGYGIRSTHRGGGISRLGPTTADLTKGYL